MAQTKTFCEAFEERPITEEHLEGMKYLVHILGRRCKKLHTLIEEKEAERKRSFFTSSWDSEDIREAKDKLEHLNEMRTLAEKSMRRCRHIREEQLHDQREVANVMEFKKTDEGKDCEQ